MPAQIVLVHESGRFRAAAAQVLRDAGYTVADYVDALAAMEALEQARTVELLITRCKFPAGRSNGAALARMLKFRKPRARVLFLAQAETHEDLKALGAFLALPASTPRLLAAVRGEIGVPSREGD